MSRICQDDVGQCDFIDVLEEAVVRRRLVGVQLRVGETFIDQMMDVVTEAGVNFAIFRSHGRVPVKEIAALSRSEQRAAS